MKTIVLNHEITSSMKDIPNVVVEQAAGYRVDGEWYETEEDALIAAVAASSDGKAWYLNGTCDCYHMVLIAGLEEERD